MGAVAGFVIGIFVWAVLGIMLAALVAAGSDRDGRQD